MDNNDKQLSDELLNSFIDHQITREERQEILNLIKLDRKLADRVCELQHIKEMTKLAYERIPASRLPQTLVLKQRILPRIAAVIAIFSLGLVMGLALTQSDRFATTFASLTADDAVTKVLVHLTSSDTASGINTLQNLQLLLDQYANNNQAVKVEVIANGSGIRLLDVSNTQIAQLVQQLTENYHNLTVAACKYSMQQMKISKGLNIKLLPQVKIIDSGVVEVIKRQNEGWTYIRG